MRTRQQRIASRIEDPLRRRAVLAVGLNKGTLYPVAGIEIGESFRLADSAPGDVAGAEPTQPSASVQTDSARGGRRLRIVDVAGAVAVAMVFTGMVALNFALVAGEFDDLTVQAIDEPTLDLVEAGGQQLPLLNFGEPAVGTTAPRTLQFRNDGQDPITIEQLSLTSNAFDLVADLCTGQVLSPADSCSVTISFFPASSGSFLDSLLLLGEGDNTFELLLIGAAVEPGS